MFPIGCTGMNSSSIAWCRRGEGEPCLGRKSSNKYGEWPSGNQTRRAKPIIGTCGKYGTSPINGGFNGKIKYERRIFHGQVWWPEGNFLTELWYLCVSLCYLQTAPCRSHPDERIQDIPGSLKIIKIWQWMPMLQNIYIYIICIYTFVCVIMMLCLCRNPKKIELHRT